MNHRRKKAQGDTDHMVRLHLWLEAEGGVSFGLGRLLLLEEIRDKGSLKAAAENMGMSYRAAWGKVKTSEQILGRPLIEKRANRSGYVLTSFGQELLKGFKDWFEAVERAAAREAERYLPFATCRYQENESQVRGGEIPSNIRERVA